MKAKRAPKRKKRSMGARIAVICVELLVLAVLLVVLYFVSPLGRKSPTSDAGAEGTDGGSTGITRIVFNEPDLTLKIDEAVQSNQKMSGYRNIALFGLDSRSGEIRKSTNSDAIMVLSVNLETYEVKIVSIYRDTYLNLSDDSGEYSKCNKAYAKGGAQQAISMLNSNLDLDIKDFVAVGFDGLTAAIDALGGVDLDVDSTELKHINNYQLTMAQDMKRSYTEVTKTGMQHLNGLQATAYCRIRYRKGDDFARTAAQREVLQAMVDRAKQSDVKSLVAAVNDVSSYVYTSLSLDEILSLAADVAKYNLVDTAGFPEESLRGAGTLGKSGSCVYTDGKGGLGLVQNVAWLHEYLFGEEDYVPSAKVQENAQHIHDVVSEYFDDVDQ